MQEHYWIFLLFALIFILAGGFLIFIRSRKPAISAADKEFYRQMWRQVERDKVRMPGKAILNADKIVDKVMASLGYTGSFGEKLKRHRTIFSDLNGIWRAHKLRNKIAHELDFEPAPAQVDDALSQFRKALMDLGLRV